MAATISPLLDAVAEPLVQFGDGGDHAHRDAGDVVGIRNERARRQEMAPQRAAFGFRQRDAGVADLRLGQRDTLGAVVAVRLLCGVGRLAMLVACRERQRPSGQRDDCDHRGDAGGHAGGKNNNPFHLRFPAAHGR